MSSEPIDLRRRPAYACDQFSVKAEYVDSLEKILVSEGEIEDRITCLAEEISRDYQHRSGEGVYLVCTLKGAMQYFATLTPELELDTTVREGFIRANRYAGGEPGAELAAVEFMNAEAIEDQDVLIVEDLIDEGNTLETIVGMVEEHNPASVDVTVLFDKVENRKTDVEIAHTGFVIPDEFVVGYGIDYDERFRRLRHLGVLDKTRLNP